LKRVLTTLMLLGLLGCSRHEPAPTPAETRHSAPPPPAAPLPNPSAPLSPGTGTLQAPPDADDDDAARHITEQNLESELDRLEREIQAE